MIIAHVLLDYDTLQSLAFAYYGDASRWQELADYNKLEYPYTMQNPEDRNNFCASGFIIATRASALKSITIKKGWTFKTKPSVASGGVAKVFIVTEDIPFPAGVISVYIPLRCTVPGSFGNVLIGTITEAGDNAKADGTVQFISVVNQSAFTGGVDLKVKFTGDTVYIPSEESLIPPDDMLKMLDIIGGEDILLDSEGAVDFSNGDIASAKGLDNITQAVTNRLLTERGDLHLHPEYGTDIPSIIGTANTPYRPKMLELEILGALKQEARISEAKVNSIDTQTTSIYLDCTYKIASSGKPAQLKTLIPLGGGSN